MRWTSITLGNKNLGLGVIVFGVVALSVLIAATLTRGPSLGAYLPWARALLQGTPAPLDDTVTLSPTGFPLFHWYPGTGVFLGFSKLLSGGAVDLMRSAQLAGSIAILVTLTFAAWLFYDIAGGRLGWVVLGLALLLVATNTGYYIRLLAAELIAQALLVSVVWLAWKPRAIGNMELGGIGALTALLVTVRMQSSIMAAPALILGALRWSEKRPHSQRVWSILTVAVPLSLGLFVVLQVNYWMTGDWTRPAYYFGNDEFKSADLTAPYLKLVLFDREAGIFSCTPFVALGLCASLVHILDRRLERAYRIFYLVSLLVGFAQIWMIAGFYSWAGGGWIFGSRYLNLLSFYAVIAVIHLCSSDRVAWAAKTFLLGVAVACAGYTAYLPRKPQALAELADIRRTAAVTSVAIVVGFVAAAVAVFLVRRSFPVSSVTAKLIAIFSIFSLVVEVSQVARLRVGAVPFQARELASPSPQFLYRNRFDVRNFEKDLKSGVALFKWPEDVQRAMTAFLEEEKQHTAIRR